MQALRRRKLVIPVQIGLVVLCIASGVSSARAEGDWCAPVCHRVAAGILDNASSLSEADRAYFERLRDAGGGEVRPREARRAGLHFADIIVRAIIPQLLRHDGRAEQAERLESLPRLSDARTAGRAVEMLRELDGRQAVPLSAETLALLRESLGEASEEEPVIQAMVNAGFAIVALAITAYVLWDVGAMALEAAVDVIDGLGGGGGELEEGTGG